MGAITDATDRELEQYRDAISKEQERRRTLANAGQTMDDIAKSVLAASGIEPGQEWKQPTSAVDAYPKDWTVEHGNKTWVSLVAANVFVPGVSGWREVAAEGVPEWVAPTGAHDAYNTGDHVMFEGVEYVSLIDSNTWSPTDYPAGWELVA